MTPTGGGDERELVAGAQSAEAKGAIPADTFAARLMLARMHAGHLSIREAADKCGIGRGAWTNWEHGARPVDRLEICRAIADALEIDYNWLLFGGPLTGPRGVPTSRKTTGPSGDTVAYPHRATRPTPTHPNGRPRTGSPSGAPRRAVRVPTLVAA
jgi:hypothetical protein